MRTRLIWIKKMFVLSIALLLTGIIGLHLATPIDAENDCEQSIDLNDQDHNKQTRDATRGSTKIDGYIQLWDAYKYVPHDGTFGDGDGHNFYLGSYFYNFRLFLSNIDTIDEYLYDIRTYLAPTVEASDIITVTSPFYNISYIGKYDYESFYYDIKIHHQGKFDTYELVLNINFYYVDSYYNHYSSSGVIYFKIQPISRIEISGLENRLELAAIDNNGNPKPLYSGAKNQILAMQNVYSASETLEDVTFNLDLPPSFKFGSTSAKVDTLTTYYYQNDNPHWLLADTGAIDVKAQKISGFCTINYKLNDMTIIEKNLIVTVRISETPILNLDSQIAESDIGVAKGGKSIANFEIYQGTISHTFDLKFNNGGNIDLREVEVELYLENAAYFYSSSFYYDETNQANKQSCGNTLLLGDIQTGQSITKSFTLRVKNNLPPGLYKIPIKYKAFYNTDGLMQMEFTEQNYHEKIIAARAENNRGFVPFILIYVNEGDDFSDKSEPDIIATSSTPLRLDTQNVMLEVKLTNLEMYELKLVNVFINTGGTSPLLPQNEIDKKYKKLSALEKNFTLNGANNNYGNNEYIVHFLVDIDPEAAYGRHVVPITVFCTDAYEQLRLSIIQLALDIEPILPNLVITDIVSTEIKPYSNFTLKVKVFNYGGSEARNVRLLYNGTSNLFSARESILPPKDIKKDEEVEFEFDIITGDVVPGMTYNSYIQTNYDDVSNSHYYFENNPIQQIPLYVKTHKTEKNLEPRDHRFVISDVFTTDIIPNSEFLLRVRLYNCADYNAHNFLIMFNGSSNLFSANQSIHGPVFILKNDEAEFMFEIMTGEVESGKTYISSILIDYSDPYGNIYPFDTNEELTIELKAKEGEKINENITEETQEEGGPKDVKASVPKDDEIEQGFALIVLGIFILVSAIIFSLIHLKASRNEKSNNADDILQQRTEMANLNLSSQKGILMPTVSDKLTASFRPQPTVSVKPQIRTTSTSPAQTKSKVNEQQHGVVQSPTPQIRTLPALTPKTATTPTEAEAKVK